MEERRLGRSDVAVSRIVLGCGSFGGIGSAPELVGQGVDEVEARRIMDTAWDLGITTFDTADAYGGGRSETMIGGWLRAKGTDVRDRLVVQTKTFNPMAEGADRGLSRARVRRQAASSLERLGLDRLPVYMTHDWDPDVPVEETLRALDELVQSGKVAAIGCSNVTAEQLAEAVEISELEGLARFEVVQNGCSLLEQADRESVFPVCHEHGLAYEPFSPLAGGILTGKYRPGEPPPAGSRMAVRPGSFGARLREPGTHAALAELTDRASGHGVSPGGLAIAWLLALPEVSAVVVGPVRADHLDVAVEALSVRLADAERDELGELFA